jgi:lysozyme
MKINAAGRQIITQCEGCKLEAYTCPAGVLTIGYGHTGDVKPGMKITQHEADVVLEYDLDRFEEAVSKLAPKANENQFSALVSLAFNVGVEAVRKSTLLKLLNAGNVRAAHGEFAKWCHVGGKVLPGLQRRRALEASLFVRPVSA